MYLIIVLENGLVMGKTFDGFEFEHQPFLPTEEDCMTCGLPKTWHNPGNVPCLKRRKPYKLRDRVDVKIGMRVWHYNPFAETGRGEIITGIVRFITNGGSIRLSKDPKDRDPNRVFDTCWDPYFEAYFSCFSSLENAQKLKDKRIAELKRLFPPDGIIK
jgi:hypothetical protein